MKKATPSVLQMDTANGSLQRVCRVTGASRQAPDHQAEIIRQSFPDLQPFQGLYKPLVPVLKPFILEMHGIASVLTETRQTELKLS